MNGHRITPGGTPREEGDRRTLKQCVFVCKGTNIGGHRRTEAGEGRTRWAQNAQSFKWHRQDPNSEQRAIRAHIQWDERQNVGCTIASSTSAFPRARSSSRGGTENMAQTLEVSLQRSAPAVGFGKQ